MDELWLLEEIDLKNTQFKHYNLYLFIFTRCDKVGPNLEATSPLLFSLLPPTT
jgi:hypothetical protein